MYAVRRRAAGHRRDTRPDGDRPCIPQNKSITRIIHIPFFYDFRQQTHHQKSPIVPKPQARSQNGDGSLPLNPGSMMFCLAHSSGHYETFDMT
jgi:hypothetical protein